MLVFDPCWKHATIVTMLILVVFRKEQSSCLNKIWQIFDACRFCFAENAFGCDDCDTRPHKWEDEHGGHHQLKQHVPISGSCSSQMFTVLVSIFASEATAGQTVKEWVAILQLCYMFGVGVSGNSVFSSRDSCLVILLVWMIAECIFKKSIYWKCPKPWRDFLKL